MALYKVTYEPKDVVGIAKQIKTLLPQFHDLKRNEFREGNTNKDSVRHRQVQIDADELYWKINSLNKELQDMLDGRETLYEDSLKETSYLESAAGAVRDIITEHYNITQPPTNKFEIGTYVNDNWDRRLVTDFYPKHKSKDYYYELDNRDDDVYQENELTKWKTTWERLNEIGCHTETIGDNILFIFGDEQNTSTFHYNIKTEELSTPRTVVKLSTSDLDLVTEHIEETRMEIMRSRKNGNNN